MAFHQPLLRGKQWLGGSFPYSRRASQFLWLVQGCPKRNPGSCGCGSNICTQIGTLVNGNLYYNLRCPGDLILTHTHVLRSPKSAQAGCKAADSKQSPLVFKGNRFHHWTYCLFLFTGVLSKWKCGVKGGGVVVSKAKAWRLRPFLGSIFWFCNPFLL